MDFIFMSAKNEANVAESNEMSDAEEHSADPVPTETIPMSASASKAADQRSDNGDAQKKQLVTNRVVSWFAACARCSFFLAGYQLEHSGDQIIEAARNNDTGWLNLDWNQAICKLLRKSYGSHLDVDCYHYEGVCPECHRQFVYHAADDESAGQLQIEIRPQAGH
jgi:hypothetical protein